MKLTPFITCTGVDDRTDLATIDRMATPGVEFGILLTDSPDGRNRYPTRARIIEAASILGERAAIHVCGKTARADMLAGRYDGILSLVGRIQINGNVAPHELAQIMTKFHAQTIITQANDHNQALLCIGLVRESCNHAVLVDGSCGRGISPAVWRRPFTSKAVGFAGGLGPDNLTRQLPRIEAVAVGEWWVDMESKVRDADDWFSVALAGQCIAAAMALFPHRFTE